MKRFTRLSTAVIIGLSLTACGQKSSDEHFQAAQAFLAKNQLNSALVELKSALQKDPQRADYRLALAELYVKAGALDDAIKEYQRANEYSDSNAQFVQNYVNVLYLNGNYSDILQLLDNTSAYTPPTHDYLLMFKAMAEAELGNAESAAVLFNELATSGQADVAHFATAFQALAKTELTEVKQQLLQIPASSPLYYQAVYLRSKIALTENDTSNAISLLKEYTTAHPYHLLPQLLLAQSFVKTAELQQADEILQPLLKKVPQQPLANYFGAVIAYDKKDFTQARIYIDTALANGFHSPQARILAALTAVNLQLENVALSHLETIKDILKHYPEAETLYAQLLLKAGNTDVAQQLLSAKQLQQSDIQLLAATAFELTKQGSTEAAQNLLAQYKTNEPHSARELLTLGAIQLKMPGQRDTAISSLEQALQLDP
ncbi:MAG TPA: tetratricopeptide repeat protein, partial [Rheinheimera sp.]|nr:tetratricopeptide repeat protein [Rheinheimera sp.]